MSELNGAIKMSIAIFEEYEQKIPHDKGLEFSKIGDKIQFAWIIELTKHGHQRWNTDSVIIPHPIDLRKLNEDICFVLKKVLESELVDNFEDLN